MTIPGHDDQQGTSAQEPAPTTPYSTPSYAAPAEPAPSYSPPPVDSAPPSYEPVPAEPAAPSYSPPAPDPTPPAAPSPFTTAYEAPAAQAPVASEAPTAVPTYPAPPVPSAPTYDPAMVAQQYSAQPYQGQYPGQQFSAPPMSGPYGYGVPMMSAIPAPVQPRKRTAVILLSIATAVLLAATGVLGTLFAIRNQDANDLADQVTQLSADATTSKNRADSVQKDLDTAKRDLTDAKAQTDQVTKQRGTLADCLNAIIDTGDALDAAGGKETPEVKAKEADTSAKCAKAQALL